MIPLEIWMEQCRPFPECAVYICIDSAESPVKERVKRALAAVPVVITLSSLPQWIKENI